MRRSGTWLEPSCNLFTHLFERFEQMGPECTAVMDGDSFLGLITRSDVLNYLRKQI